jgi:hypothetical protein
MQDWGWANPTLVDCLLCGDATDAACVSRLLGSVRPHLMVTEPPSGVEYEPAWRNEAGASQSRRTGKGPQRPSDGLARSVGAVSRRSRLRLAQRTSRRAPWPRGVRPEDKRGWKRRRGGSYQATKTDSAFIAALKSSTQWGTSPRVMQSSRDHGRALSVRSAPLYFDVSRRRGTIPTSRRWSLIGWA